MSPTAQMNCGYYVKQKSPPQQSMGEDREELTFVSIAARPNIMDPTSLKSPGASSGTIGGT